jgi:rifampin ADP-ribosylating transferase
MAIDDHQEHREGRADQDPFVVTHPCAVCGGQGTADGRPCPACRGTGVGRFFHGTKADLEPGDLIESGRTPNFGRQERTTNYVYLTGTLDAAVWGAELAAGNGPGRIYIVEPTGEIEDDPNLTDQKYPGNPTRSYRSRQPLRVVGEVTAWQGHSPEALEAMKEGLERLRREGVEPLDD